MTYINVGAFVNGARPRTKKALREALANAPETVTFDQTAMWADDSLPVGIRVSDIPVGLRLSVVGPDPFTSRRWFASVTRDFADGKVRLR